MSRKLDIGVASYGSPEKLHRTLTSIRQRSTTDWRCWIVDNPSPDPKTREVISQFCDEDNRFQPFMLAENIGYAGAVNRILDLAETEYIAYCDNDILINTDGWDELLCLCLDRYHEVGIVFPNGQWANAPIQRLGYIETLWGLGCCWLVSRMAVKEVGQFDPDIGHQEECDYCLRLRMAGFRCATLEIVSIHHDATATTNAASTERINRGVINFVNKWNAYFCGRLFNYHSPNVLRWEDWPPNALYLEEYYKQHVPDLNAAPEVMNVNGREYDLLRVPRYKDFYRGRII